MLLKKYLDLFRRASFMYINVGKVRVMHKFEVLSLRVKSGKRLKDDYGDNDGRMISLNGFMLVISRMAQWFLIFSSNDSQRFERLLPFRRNFHIYKEQHDKDEYM